MTQMLPRWSDKAKNEALCQLIGGWQRGEPCPGLADRLAGASCPAQPPLSRQLALTQDVGGHPQQGVEHVMHLPVPLDHVR